MALGIPADARMHEGAADVFRFVAATPLGRGTPETRDRSRDGKSVVRQLAQRRQ